MANILRIHKDNPQDRLIQQAIHTIRNGGLIIYPTDSGYAIGWSMENLKAPKIVSQIKDLDNDHHFTLMCENISQITDFALVNNVAFRLIKQHTPGAYTFILPATRRVPKKLQHQKRRSIGIRISAHGVVQALLEALGEPMMSSSLELPGEDMYEWDADDINVRIGHRVNSIIDSGFTPQEPSTVVDLTGDAPVVIREGKGEIDFV
ncbi:L-threonylcarbamoyladenylate synthase [Marinicella sp. W31]|uniref:L-threonylcarbamoyladenylate synthase n=1 Tax=Marinicella sp. W31 TaxID=3023713 RepID=UPI003756AF33